MSLPGAGGEDGDGAGVVNKGLVVEGEDMLGERETIMLSLQFCLLWFVVCVPPSPLLMSPIHTELQC